MPIIKKIHKIECPHCEGPILIREYYGQPNERQYAVCNNCKGELLIQWIDEKFALEKNSIEKMMRKEHFQ